MTIAAVDGAKPDTVNVSLNYSLRTDKRPRIYNEDHTKNELSLISRVVPVTDADAAEFRSDMGVQGFCRVDHPISGQNVIESQGAINAYLDSLRPLMLVVTGADEIIMNPATVVRRQKKSADTPEDSAADSVPVDFIHTDVSLDGAGQIAELYLAATKPTIRRWALFNMWRLLSPGPTNRPLALCDSSSVDRDDIIPGDSLFPDGLAFETAFLRPSPNHRWYYYSQLTSDQLLVFKQGDSDDSYPQLVPHTAFNRIDLPYAAGRISLESRCMAIWF